MLYYLKKLISFVIKKQTVILPTDNYVSSRIDRYSIVFLEELICINRINQDTEDFHCHPWDFISIILWGGYTEIRIVDGKEVTKKFKAGSILYRKFNDFHQILLLKNKAITLFIKVRNKSNNTSWMKNGIYAKESSYWLRQGYKKADLKNMIKKTKEWKGLFDNETGETL
tara:strand:- start:401 stop:910 length:510 start_codon:yes stop_codon:yes gene_type:complete